MAVLKGGLGVNLPLEGQKSKKFTIFWGKILPYLCLHLPLTKDLDYKYTSEQENNMHFLKKLSIP